jgi:aspartokinase
LSKIKIGGIVRFSNLFCISLAGASKPTTTSAVLLNALAEANINVQFIVQGSHRENSGMLVFCVDRVDQAGTMDIVHTIQSTHEFHILDIDPQVTSIGIYGPDFRIQPGLASAFLGALDTAGVDVQAISTSISTFSVIVPSVQADLALSAIDQVFELP